MAYVYDMLDDSWIKRYTLVIILMDGRNGIMSILSIYLLGWYESIRHVCLTGDDIMTNTTWFQPFRLDYLLMPFREPTAPCRKTLR
jgi:hypothetical protein